MARWTRERERRYYRFGIFLVVSFVFLYLTLVRPELVSAQVLGFVAVIYGGMIASGRRDQPMPREKGDDRDKPDDPHDADDPTTSARRLAEDALARLRELLAGDDDPSKRLDRRAGRGRWVLARLASAR